MNDELNKRILAAREYAECQKRYDKLLSIATELSENNNLRDAITLLNEYYEMFNKSFMYVYKLGIFNHEIKDYTSAIDCFNSALLLSKENLGCRYRLGKSLIMSCGDSKIASKANFWKAIDNFKAADDIWLNLVAPNKMDEEIYSRICESHAKLLENLPTNQEATLKYYKLALNLRDDDNTRYNLAKYLTDLGNIDEAEKYFPKSANSFYVIHLAAQIAFLKGEFRMALEKNTEVVVKYKKSYALSLQFKIYDAMNDVENAYLSIQQLLEKHKSPRNMIDYASFLVKRRLYSEARVVINQARKICEDESFDAKLHECNILSKQLIELTSSGIEEDLDLVEKLQKCKVVVNTPGHRGEITMYNENKGFGFLSEDSESYFFHISNCINFRPSKGMIVTFDDIISNGKKAAVNLKPL